MRMTSNQSWSKPYIGPLNSNVILADEGRVPMSFGPSEGRRLPDAGLGRVLADAASECTKPLDWYQARGPVRGPIINSGSIVVVDLGDGPLGVTARPNLEGLMPSGEFAS